ncbi:MAG: Leucyl/phenylalanyl-tRNA--protein transferase [Pseudomonadota bacterium]
MSEDTPQPPLPWIESQDPLPPVENAWGKGTDAPGLLAAGADLGVERLLAAYSHGIFPWFNPDQPVLWWSPDPRMVLKRRFQTSQVLAQNAFAVCRTSPI